MPSIRGWYRPILETETLAIRSQIYFVVWHWDPATRQNVRCQVTSCPLCEELPQIRTWVCAVSRVGQKIVQLLEFRERHAELVERLEIQGLDVIGQKLYVCKEEDSKHSPVEILTTRKRKSQLSEPESKAEVSEVYCKQYVKALGMRGFNLAMDLRESGQYLAEISEG